MTLNIKDPEAHKLAQTLAKETGESMTHAVTQALRERLQAVKVGALRSLKGVHLAFTGILSRPRAEAARAARRAGAVVHDGPSRRTSVVVRGRPNTLQAAGRDAGLNLMEIKRLSEKGHRIKLLDERRFWRLVKMR